MDASSLERNSQRQNQNNEQDIYCSGRTLCELPDNVLSLIVSFLRTEEAVRTSILSKRWESIWTSIPRFYIEQRSAKTVDFINFVDRAFLLCGSSTDIHLEGTVNGLSRVEAWFSAAVKCNVQSLTLYLDIGDVVEPLSLPLSLANCGTLTCLRIDICVMLKLPSPICFSSLKTLVLNHVEFTDDHSVQQLFSGSPVLQHLALRECSWVNVTVANIFSPNLLTLFIEEIDWEVYEGPKSSDSCEFVILANILSLKYRGGFCYDFCILDTSSLEEVSIDISSYANSLGGASNRFFKLLSSIAEEVPCLKLSGESTIIRLLLFTFSTSPCSKLLVDAPLELLNNMPTFTNLSYLELLDESTDLRNVVLWKILESMPFLENLKFKEGFFMFSAIESEDEILDPVPSCFLDNLDCIHIGIEEANEVELSVIKILLKKAKVLTKMVIDFGAQKEDEKKEFCEELLKLPRSSSNCAVHIQGW